MKDLSYKEAVNFHAALEAIAKEINSCRDIKTARQLLQNTMADLTVELLEYEAREAERQPNMLNMAIACICLVGSVVIVSQLL